MYQEIPHLGAVYAEVQPPHNKRWFEVDREDGETFIWIGRFHCILTPWRRLRRVLTAMAGLFTIFDPLSMKVAAAAGLLLAAPVALEADQKTTDDQLLKVEAEHQWQEVPQFHAVSVRAARASWLTSP